MNRPWIYLLIACLIGAGACAHKGATTGGAGSDPGNASAPISGLAGTAWVVEEVRGRPVIDKTKTPLRFDADGRASGSTGCNSFSGATTLVAPNLSFAPMATTRMACEPPLMTQEQDLLNALGAVRTYSIAPDGTLRLLAEDGQPLVRLTRTDR